MTTAPAEPAFGTVIIGGGAGGVLVAIRLLMDGRSTGPVAIVEPAAGLGRGAAYSTGRAEHLLNVVAGRMSAFSERPGDFVDFLAREERGDRSALPGRFLPRRDYGRYLCHTLETLPRQHAPTHVRDRAVDLERDADGFQVHLASGGSVAARHVVLAVGNAPRPLPAYLRHPGMRLVDAWDYDALQRIEPAAEVCILGSGLSMVDAVLTLDARGHRGPIRVVSRHGLVPLPHAHAGPHDGSGVDELLPLSVRGRSRLLRDRVAAAMASGEPWQWSFDRLRPHGQALWRSLEDAQRRRFLRHAVRYWDIHRHRIAPQAHATLSRLRASGQLQVIAGRLQAIGGASGGGSLVQVRPRLATQEQVLPASWIINATGVETSIDLRPEPLLAALRERGTIIPGPQGLGVASNGIGHVVDRRGRGDPAFYVLGALRIGDLWESIAIPELRDQARDIASDILGADVARRPRNGQLDA